MTSEGGIALGQHSGNAHISIEILNLRRTSHYVYYNIKKRYYICENTRKHIFYGIIAMVIVIIGFLGYGLK